MKYIFLLLIFMLELFGSVIRSPIISINADETEVTIKIQKIDIGISGSVVHKIDDNHKTIIKNAVVTKFDENTKVATLKLSDYTAFGNETLPKANFKIKIGDYVILTFGYNRGLLIAPSEDIYYRITKKSQVQWVHPDIFATSLSFVGHPTPLREDFTRVSESNSIGLIYIFLDNTIYTVDAKSFKILAATVVSLIQEEIILPFYTRIQKIDANWWGEGSSELEDYEPHYYELIAEANPNNKELYQKIKDSKKKLQYILEKFNIKE
ncbi:MAG: plasminogen-binding N-terminal domain-containing protein [Sulfurimonas sp.]|nr:plasminogen-binding N-terminal domain-containing protein [Sulfurimonas sp.]